MKKRIFGVFLLTMSFMLMGCSDSEIAVPVKEEQIIDEVPFSESEDKIEEASNDKEEPVEEEPEPEDEMEDAEASVDVNITTVRGYEDFLYTVETDASGNQVRYHSGEEPVYYFLEFRPDEDGVLYSISNRAEIGLQFLIKYHIEILYGKTWKDTGKERAEDESIVLTVGGGSTFSDGLYLGDFELEPGEYRVVRRFIAEIDSYDTYYGNIYFTVNENGEFTDFSGEFIPGDYTYGEF